MNGSLKLTLACVVAAIAAAFQASAQTIRLNMQGFPHIVQEDTFSHYWQLPVPHPQVPVVPPELEQSLDEFLKRHDLDDVARQSIIQDLGNFFVGGVSKGCGLAINLGCNQGSISHGGMQEQAGEKMRCKCIDIWSGCHWVFASEWD